MIHREAIPPPLIKHIDKCDECKRLLEPFHSQLIAVSTDVKIQVITHAIHSGDIEL